MKEEQWKRLTLEQNEADEGDKSDAEVLGVCHRPGCAVPNMGCAKTLNCQSALKRHVEVSGREPLWLSHVRPVKFREFDESTQHLWGAVELEWDAGEKVIRFVAHMVPPGWMPKGRNNARQGPPAAEVSRTALQPRSYVGQRRTAARNRSNGMLCFSVVHQSLR